MDVNAKIEELIEIVESARAMPMSASCVINRAQVLELLDGLKTGMPDEMERARRVLSDRESVLEEGRREAERMLERSRGERDSIINNTDISREARDAATRILDDARRDADQIRDEADEYVDQKLANFEVVLTKTLQAVGRGRDKMRGSNPMEELGRHVDEQDLVQAERKRSRDFSGTGEIPEARGAFEEDGYDSGSFETTGEFTRVAFEEAERPYEAHPHGGYEQQPEYDAQPAYDQQQPGYEQQQQPGYDPQPAYEQQQPGYEQQHQQQGYAPEPYYAPQGYEQPGYDQGAVQGYGTGEFAEQQYQEGYDQSGHWNTAGDGYAHGGMPQQVPGPEYPADDNSYFDTGLIDVRQFQQQQYR